jgi:hypothetical protein
MALVDRSTWKISEGRDRPPFNRATGVGDKVLKFLELPRTQIRSLQASFLPPKRYLEL